MAGEPKTSGPNLGGNAFVWVAIVAAALAYVSGRGTLENLRPRADELSTVATHAAQDIDARLWQDPFETVLKADGAYYGWSSATDRKVGSTPHLCHPAGAPQEDMHCLSPLSGDNSSAQAIGIIVPGGPYSEDTEFRRRTRYAVLAALDVLGYAPDDAQHIGVFIPPPPSTASPDDPGSCSDAGGPQFIPYEVLQRPGTRLTLFWIDEESLSCHPLDRLVRLFSALHPTPTNGYRFKILGPQGSDTLLAMLQNIADPPRSATDAAVLQALDIYDYSATADAVALCRQVLQRGCSDRETSGDWVATQFKRVGINFSRATATDDVLARAINVELNRRGIHPGKAQIALVSEWDTFYGRMLPETFARCLTADSKDGSCDENGTDDDFNQQNHVSQWLSRYSYLRGLDGQTAEASTASQNKAPTALEGTPPHAPAGAPADLLSETAQGQGQGDYLERLASKLRHKDERSRNDGGEGIQAVGIVGSDLYDKLLVFQALRSALPRAVFFTTDLDERLIRPAQGFSTVNLIVASALGLSLGDGLQRDIPPFRGSYQTAAFLATLMAGCVPASAPGNGGSNCDSGKPRPASGWFERAETYEIGRTRPILLPAAEKDASAPSLAKATPPVPDCGTGTGPLDVFTCASILPVPPPQLASTARLHALAFLEAGAALALAWLLLRLAIGPQLPLSRWFTALLVAGVVATIQLDAGAHTLIDVTLVFQGVSLGPSICIQLLSSIFGIAVIFKVARSSSENVVSLRKRLFMSEILDDVESGRRSRPFRLREALPFRWTGADTANRDAKHPVAGSIAASARFWVRYIDYARHHVQFWRVSALVIIGTGLAWVVYLAFPWPSPTAGETTSHLYSVVAWVDGFTTLAVALYVADITLFSRLFVREAFARDRDAPVWPHRAMAEFSKSSLRTALKPEDDIQEALVTTTMTIAYVSERTKCITSFIYYPFIMIALSVISRSPVLGPSTLDPWAITISAMSLIVAFVSAIALRSAAEDARSETIRHLSILKWRALTPDSPVELRQRLDLLLERVAALQEGAFSPLSQQPVVRALLLPLASYGSTLLLGALSIGG